MLTWNIRTRLITSFLLLILVTVSTIGGYILWYFYQHNLQVLTNNLLAHAQITEHLLISDMNHPHNKYLLDEKIKNMSSKTELRITVLDVNGAVLADSWESPAVMENHSERPEVKNALATGSGTAIRYSTTLGQNLLYAAMPIRSGEEILGVVRVSNTMSHIENGFNQIRNTLLLVMLVISILAIALSIRLAKKYTHPLEQITQTAQAISGGNLTCRVHIKTGDELEFLAQTLNNLAANLDEKIKETTAEAHKLSLILRHMDNAVILLDRYGRVTNANKMATDLFNIKPDMLGQHNLHAIGNSQLNQAIEATLKSAESRLIDLKTQINDHKKVFQVFVSPISMTDKEPGGILAVFHDITALQEIYERQAEFVANASHELATPLTSIKGFAETLLDGALHQPSLSEKFITIIYNEAERMHRLLQDLLKMAKLNSQEYRQQIQLEPTILNPLLAQVVQDLSIAAQRKQHILSLSQGTTAAVLAHADWLKQAISNLVDNSIKYTPEGGHIQLTCQVKDQTAIIQISDTGIGIPAADLPLIFDRFYRVERARTRSTGGTGLGLAIVKFIVDMHGGQITVTSQPNQGTTFIITLPLLSAATAG